MNIKIIVVGKLKEQYWKDACEEYLKRLTRFANVNIFEVNEEKLLTDNTSHIEQVKSEEGKRIIEKINDKDYVCLLDIHGKEMDSLSLANEFNTMINVSNSKLVFIIGGSYGVSKEVKERANFLLSFSKLTFPHQMARVILLEQIYRYYQIINNGRYHK